MARVLITDDDEMDRVLLNDVLGSAGHDLFFATEGESALDAYREQQIDVVVADLLMPHVDGLELIDRLLELDTGACVVAVSGAGRPVLEKAEEAGALVTLEKPVDPAELLEAVERAATEREKRADPWT